jgi:hypothetical protein
MDKQMRALTKSIAIHQHQISAFQNAAIVVQFDG